MDPIPIGTAVVAIVGAVGAAAWYLRGHLAKDQIAALQERLGLAQDKYSAVRDDLENVRAQAAEQTKIIAELRSNSATAQVEQLNAANAMVLTADSMSYIYGVPNVLRWDERPPRQDSNLRPED